MSNHWRALTITVLLGSLSLAANPVLAAGLERPAEPAKPRNADFDNGKKLIEQAKYRDAIPLLQKAVQAEPNNADAYNLLGFATRKSGDAQGSLAHYNKALSIDPKHLGAHEYAGEAYLMLGDLKKAEEHLARLDSLCVFGCAEYRMLRDKVNAFKQGKRPGT